MSELADIIEQDSEAILEHWTRQVDSALAPGSPTETELRDHLPVFLKELVAVLRQGAAPATSPAGKAHGRQRHELRFTLPAVVREYGLLSEVILAWVEQRGPPVSLGEVRVFNAFIASAIAEGVAEHERQRVQAKQDTERRHSAELFAREESFSTTLHSIGDAVIATDRSACITFLNPVAERLTGWSRADASGLPLAQVFRIINEHSREPVDSPVERVLVEGTVQGLAHHTLLIRKDGTEVAIDDSAAPIRRGDGQLDGVVLVFRDISVKKAAEELLARQARHTRLVADVSQALARVPEMRAMLQRCAQSLVAHLDAAFARVWLMDEALETLVLHASAGLYTHLDGPHGRVPVGRFKIGLIAQERQPHLSNSVLDDPRLGDPEWARREGLVAFAGYPLLVGEKLVGVVALFARHPLPADTLEALRQVADTMALGIVRLEVEARNVELLARESAARAEAERISEELRLNERRLQDALTVTGTGTWELDLATSALTADLRSREMFGLTPEEPFDLARGLALVHAEDRERVAALVEGAMAGRDDGRYEADYRTVPRPEGGSRWVAARGQVTFDASGRALRFVGTGTDITARKQAELARTSLLSSLSDQSLFGIAVLRGEELRFEAANSVYRHLVGDRDVVGKPLLEALPEFAGQGADAGLREVLRTGRSFSGQELSYFMTHHGAGAVPEERSFSFVWQPVFDSSGRVDSILVITHDVTEQVRARQRVETLLGQLAASEEQLKRVVAASGAGLWELCGATGRMTADARMVELMGLPPGTVFNLASGLDEVNPEDRELVIRAVEGALAGENQGQYLMLFRTGGRHGVPERWVESRAQRLVDAEGSVVLAGAMLDITARKQAEAERERLFKEVEASRVRLSNLIENAPAFVATLREPQHVFEMVNPHYRQLVGQGRVLQGLTVREALPEVVEQGFLELLDSVYRTGTPFIGRELPIQLDRAGEGQLESAFVNFVYQPRRDIQGRVEGIDVFGFEVTEQVVARQRAESLSLRLRESEERLRRVVEASGAGFWELDAATGRVTADARVMTLLGLTPGAPLHLELALACVYAEDRERITQAVATALSGEAGEHFLMTFRSAGLGDLPLRWVENRGQRRLDANGRAVALAGALLDITERKEAEEVGKTLLRALGESEERYRMSTRATKDAIWDWNLVTNGVTWNEGLYELFGFAPAEVRPDAAWWLEHIHPEDRERISQSIHAIIDVPPGSAWNDTYRFQRRNGSWATVEDRGWVARAASGHALRMVGAMQDVTERKAAEESTARKSRHNALNAQVGRALSRSTSVSAMLQACAESLVNQLGLALARVWLFNPQNDRLELHASAGLPLPLEDSPSASRAGDSEWARREGMNVSTGYPLQVGDKQVGELTLLSRHPLEPDTLELLRLVADSITLGVERLKGEDELKTRVDFEQKLIGIVSHDLRNPLSAIIMGTSMLARREGMDARTVKSLVRIQSAAERASRMVKDLLDFTQARLGGGLRIAPLAMDLHGVTRGVVEEVEAASPGREIQVRHEGDGQLEGDADRLAQVVQNLVTNALKYSPGDSVVRITTRGQDTEVDLSVANGGPPIPADKLTSIFEPMQRATAELDLASRSVGLGLYIVKRIVDAHEGRISVTSTEADGTVFTVSLPRSRKPSPS